MAREGADSEIVASGTRPSEAPDPTVCDDRIGGLLATRAPVTTIIADAGTQSEHLLRGLAPDADDRFVGARRGGRDECGPVA